MSHLMTSMTEIDGAANQITEETAEITASEQDANAHGDSEGNGAVGVSADGETQRGDDEIEEEVIEEEYYEEEEEDEEEYDEEEIIEEFVDDGDDDGSDDDDGGAVDTQDSSQGRSDYVERTAFDTSPSEDGSVHKVPEGTADFAIFPPMSVDQAADHGADQSMDFADFTAVTEMPGGEDISTKEATGRDVDEESPPFNPPIVPAPPTTYNQEAAEVEKETDKPSSCWYWLVFFLICGLLGAGAYVGWFLVNKDRKDAPDLGEADGTTRPPTPAPTIGETTFFDPVQGDCNFRELQNPHVIDQCICVGEIQIIADDVRARYDSRRENFIPTIYENFDEDINSCSPRNQALVWISSGNDFEFSYLERVDRFALGTLYAGLNGNDWVRNGDWLSEKSACVWEGITCDDDGRVQILELSRNNLVGTMPPEVGLLANLVWLYAASNLMEGPIPEAIFFILGLEIVDLGSNAFTGPIPPAVGNVRKLRELSLDDNNLNGRISQNLAGAESLELLRLGGNQLEGSVPVTLFDLDRLQILDLGGNSLTGTIADDIRNFRELTFLSLGPNRFGGEIPSAIGELRNLEYLFLRDIPQLGGRLPVAFGRNLKKMLEISITKTSVAGNIETDFGALPKLIKMDLSENQLRGTIPMELGNLGNLTALLLGDNFLEGPIPVTFGNLFSLTTLSLNNNLLGGGVPVQLSMLQSLDFLRLDGTLLTGRVPNEVCDLRDMNLTNFVVDCPFVGSDGVQEGVICDIPSCCTGCRTEFRS